MMTKVFFISMIFVVIAASNMAVKEMTSLDSTLSSIQAKQAQSVMVTLAKK